MDKKKITFTLAVLVFALCSLTPEEAFAQNFKDVQAEPSKEEISKDAPPTPAIPKSEDEVIDEALARVAADSAPAPEELSEPANALSGMSSRYTLGPLDVVEVTVLRHPEVSGEYVINQEGNIQYEFVGDVQISGLTKDEAAKVVSERLTEYIISPEVSVKIKGYNSKIVYVVGEVGQPGKIYMRGDTISVREALMQAGLPQLTGVTRKSRLITPSETGNAQIKKVDVYALLYEGDLRENYEMKPGDVIFIPATFLTKAMRAIQPVAAPIGTAAGTGRTVISPF